MEVRGKSPQTSGSQEEECEESTLTGLYEVRDNKTRELSQYQGLSGRGSESMDTDPR